MRSTFLCFKPESHFGRDSGSSLLPWGLRSHRNLPEQPSAPDTSGEALYRPGSPAPPQPVWKETMVTGRRLAHETQQIHMLTHTCVSVCMYIIYIHTYIYTCIYMWCVCIYDVCTVSKINNYRHQIPSNLNTTSLISTFPHFARVGSRLCRVKRSVQESEWP